MGYEKLLEIIKRDKNVIWGINPEIEDYIWQSIKNKNNILTTIIDKNTNIEKKYGIKIITYSNGEEFFLPICQTKDSEFVYNVSTNLKTLFWKENEFYFLYLTSAPLSTTVRCLKYIEYFKSKINNNIINETLLWI